ncbi:NAD(P)-binding domain-containing protein [Streptomyces sp. AS58]|uniref:NAD(P)-binding domain-containing protein n=1 Tax=Streptomyces sp. AS58 TaxID=1519489 RepID=UPI001F198881|nr:NAD(P)-binding domain-containing protein [Streptomyces sp. AS58]
MAIIGAGNVGTALSKTAVAAGHRVLVSATDRHQAVVAEAERGARASGNNSDAVSEADTVKLAVTGGAAKAVGDELALVLHSKVVVDLTDPLNATFTDRDIEETAAPQTSCSGAMWPGGS